MATTATTVTIAKTASLSAAIHVPSLLEHQVSGRPMVSLIVPAALEATTERVLWHGSDGGVSAVHRKRPR